MDSCPWHPRVRGHLAACRHWHEGVRVRLCTSLGQGPRSSAQRNQMHIPAHCARLRACLCLLRSGTHRWQRGRRVSGLGLHVRVCTASRRITHRVAWPNAWRCTRRGVSPRRVCTSSGTTRRRTPRKRSSTRSATRTTRTVRARARARVPRVCGPTSCARVLMPTPARSMATAPAQAVHVRACPGTSSTPHGRTRATRPRFASADGVRPPCSDTLPLHRCFPTRRRPREQRVGLGDGPQGGPEPLRGGFERKSETRSFGQSPFRPVARARAARRVPSQDGKCFSASCTRLLCISVNVAIELNCKSINVVTTQPRTDSTSDHPHPAPAGFFLVPAQALGSAHIDLLATALAKDYPRLVPTLEARSAPAPPSLPRAGCCAC